MKPIYDIHKSYLENAEEGPFFEGELPKIRELPRAEWTTFLDRPVASRIGVPAGPLLNANWTALACRLGYDIVTYKTIRSRAHPAHGLPNMVFVEADRFLDPKEEGSELKLAQGPPQVMESLAMTNSFGIPSRDPDYLRADIAKAKSLLGPGQLLIVSVVGTPREGEDYIQDFAEAARIALEAGCEIIEADLSCPNIASREGSLYSDPESIFRISQVISKISGERPLILKLGMIQDRALFSKIAHAALKGGARAICGINTLSMKVVDEFGKPALGEKRVRAGVCGKPIRQAALTFTRLAHEVIAEERLDLALMVTGGVTEYSHFDDLFDAGADVAMTGLGMMWDPYLAMHYHMYGKRPWLTGGKR